MAEVRSVVKYIRMSPHKMRLVTDLVRGRDVDEALNVLRFTPKAAAKVVAQAIAAAAANADENLGLASNELYVAEIRADEAPRLRRGHPGARGRYKPIIKRGAHLTVVLAEKAGA